MNIANLSPEEQRKMLERLLKEKAQKEKAEPIPLSFAQQRLWFLEQFMPDSPVYNYPLAMRLKGTLRREALEYSLNEIVRRHDTLRTTIYSEEGKPYQQVHAFEPLSLGVVDVSHVAEDEREEHAQKIARVDIQRPMDLEKGPLFRPTLIRLAEQDHIFIVNTHHIITDGWSTGVFTNEFAQLYTAFINGDPSPLAPLAIQYTDFTKWQRNWLQGEVLEEQLSYWKQKLGGTLPVLELPTDRPRSTKRTLQGMLRKFALPKQLSADLKATCQREGVTLYMVLLAAWKTLLYRYSGQDDLIIGTPIANRNREEVENLIGFFVNTLVLRTDLSGNPSFRELLERVRETSYGAYSHQDLPFDKLVEELQPDRDMSQSPLFQTMFQLQNVPMKVLELPGLSIEGVPIYRDAAKFDLTLNFIDSEESETLIGYLEYSMDLYEEVTIVRMLVHFQNLLEGIIADPGQGIDTLPMLTPEERHQLLVEWNDTDSSYPRDICVHQQFETQAAQTPDAIAVVAGDRTLTYRELNERANQLAHHLQTRGVGPEVLVGICVERSHDMIIGMLGILKAGGAYVPIDPSNPQDRVVHILSDANVNLLLTQQHLLHKLPAHSAITICLDSGWETIASEPTSNPSSAVTPENLVYIIFTSGSTGKPKGVMIIHRGLTNYLSWAAQAYEVQAGQGAPVHSSIAFDLTITGLFLPLLSGKKVVLLPETDDLEALSHLLRENDEFSLVKLTPAHLQMLAHQLAPDELPRRALKLIIGGEALTTENIALWQQHAPETQLINEYGPTETVVGCAVYEVPPSYQERPQVPIGRPIANTQLYVLDRHMQPVPIGVIGELHIGGDGVARGYLNRPDLTEEKFVSHPFAAEPGARLYKTGDLARYLSDGNIEFLGRIDDQVKIRGYRIELGEIEAALTQHPSVKAAVVAVLGDNTADKRLVAYIVPAGTELPNTEELQQFLQEQLPEYMVPNTFVELEELPLSASGKVNRKKLPTLDALKQASNIIIGPRDPLEITMVEIWEDILGVSPIGVHDNFFALGGHSLTAIELFARMRTHFATPPMLNVLFETPTVADLCNSMRGTQTTTSNTLVRLQKGDGSRPPLFLVHPGSGVALCYYDLAKALGPQTTVYGVQAVGLETDEAPLSSITEMAARYVREIRETVPVGPYHIAGWSFGGTVAYEMVRHLEELGETVDFLGLFDAIPADIRVSDDPAKLRVLGQLAVSIGMDKATISEHDEEQSIELLWTRAQELNLLPDWETMETYKRKLLVNVEIAVSRDNYMLSSPIRTNLHLFRTSELAPVNALPLVDPELWRTRTIGDLYVIPIPGHHHNLVEPPHVTQLAAEMRACWTSNRYDNQK